MKITIIGSTQYQHKMNPHKLWLEAAGHEVKIPIFDDCEGLNELEICQRNREQIAWADEVHIFWDQRSIGTIFDFGIAFALNKTIHIIYLESKTIANVMRMYEAEGVFSEFEGGLPNTGIDVPIGEIVPQIHIDTIRVA